MREKLTLGSLFDGSGGFPFGGILSGIEPIWASEIEPFAIRVTTKRIPQMKHYGDVSKLHGGDLEPVDIITFGSPCQDMSSFGKRDGLHGNKSRLFFEAIRIIKEMREKTNGKKPRWIIWENVYGAFLSNHGADFQRVLEEIIGIAEPGATVPTPKKGKWPYADVYVGDGFSVAYRLFDSQFWGVPQRRKRVYLVADFGAESAGKILFEQKSMRGDSFEGETEQFEITANGRASDKITDSGNGEYPSYGIRGAGGYFRCCCNEEVQPTLTCDTGIVFQYLKEKEKYILRRLMPKECARLQGFPANWCENLETPEPTAEEISFWLDIFEEYRKIVTKATKQKTRIQIIKWLKNPYSESKEYQLWGNGVTLPIVQFILERINKYYKEEH